MPLSLLVLQPTPFCNLDCDYCYLPHRSDRSRMSMATLATALRRVFESGLVGPGLSIVWHAGEPLVLPPAYYEEAFATIERERPPEVEVQHSFQTNATLLDDEWCRLIRAYDVRIGVSIDGPNWLHDRHRKTRSGRGTHAAALKGATLLRRHAIPFHVICVLTRDSLACADEIFDFFRVLKVDDVGFNIEEIEGVNQSSSLTASEVEAEFVRFFERILERLRQAPRAFRVREVDEVLAALRHPNFGRLTSNSQNEPLGIVSIAHDGGLSTFSPELLGWHHPAYGSFTFGNISNKGIGDMLADGRFLRVAEDVARGVKQCRETCKYFDFCRGGAPANKLAETGTFAASETMFCRLTEKAVIECVLRALEQDLETNFGDATGAESAPRLPPTHEHAGATRTALSPLARTC